MRHKPRVSMNMFKNLNIYDKDKSNYAYTKSFTPTRTCYGTHWQINKIRIFSTTFSTGSLTIYSYLHPKGQILYNSEC